MKKIYTYISILALAAVSAGCAEELANPEDQLTNSNKAELVNGELTVQLSVPTSAATKTVLGLKNGDSYPVYWSPEDVITLNGVAATEFTPSDDNTTAAAKFKVTNLAAPYNFLYGGVSGTSNQVSFPATQNYVEGSFDPAAMPMYASVKDVNSNITFSHVASLLKFSFTGTNQISTINISAGEQALAGNFTIGTTDGVLDGTLTSGAGNSNLVYNFGGNKQLSQTPFVFYVAVPAGTYPSGITLDIIDNDSGHMTVKVMNTEESNTIDAGKVREFENVTYAPTKELNLIQINSEATLQQFASRVAAGETTLNARVIADFAVSSSWTSVEGYNGIFDGNSKTIIGLDQPLFGVLGGVVKNLTLDSNITATESHNWGIFAKQVTPSIELDDVAGLQNCTAKGSLTYTPEALTKDCQLGGLVGNNKGGAVSNCINEATVTMGDSGVTHGYEVSIGGVVGRTQKGGDLNAQGDISNCTNNGTVVCEAKLGDKNLYIGGVLGFQVQSAEYISECVNNGIVKVNASFSTGKALHLGGVIGLGAGKIESCTNGPDGTVISEDGSAAGSYICQGGVVGRLSSSSRTYSGLTNAGNITAYAAGAKSGAYIGGMVGRCDEGASLSNCTNTGGKLEYLGATSTCPLHIGGIVGQSKGTVTSCTNATSIYFNADYKYNKSSNYLSIGGVVGKQDADVEISNNINTAAVTFEGYNTGYMALGGIVGYCYGPISNGENSGTISFKGEAKNQAVAIGGVVAKTPSGTTGDRINGVTNKGAVVINTEKELEIDFYVGAVVGHSQSGNISATNNGKVEISKLQCSNFYVGGVAGKTAGDVNATNKGNIELAEVTVTNKGANIFVGGVAGQTESGSMTGTNNGALTISEACTVEQGHILAGGVVGNAQAPLTDCTNTGIISNAGTVNTNGKFIDLGGVVGYNEGAAATLTNCSNSGNVINTGNSAGYLCIGGVSGETEAAIEGCDNTGNISNSSTSDNGNPTCVGGVAGLAYAIDVTSCSSATGKITNTSASLGVRVGGIVGMYDTAEAVNVSNCTNESEIYISNEVSVATDDQILVGGIVGRGSPITFTSCENKGEIKVEMYGEDNLGGVIAGGIYGDNKSGDNAYLNDVTSCVNYKKIHTYYKYDGSSQSAQQLYAIGGIAGIVLSSTAESETQGEINDCSNFGYLYNESNRGLVGGIVADFQDGSIMDCTNTNTVEYSYNADMTTIIAVGGIVANAWDKAKFISDCTNGGDVIAFTHTYEAIRSNYAGGIVGLAEDICEVRDCENTGSITCNTCANTNNAVAMAGGIIGYKQSNSKDSGNINRGDVTSLARYKKAGAAGGVVGALRYGTIEACYNYGTIEAGEKANDNGWGDTNAKYSNGRAGSIVGFYGTSAMDSYEACEGTITKCYVGGAIKGKYTSGKLTTITAENFGSCIVGEGNDPTDCFFAGN